MLLPIHIAAGGLAIVLGAVALSVKKGGTLHRRSGLLFVYAMLVMGVSASILSILKGRDLGNVFAGVLTAYFVGTALTTVRPGIVLDAPHQRRCADSRGRASPWAAIVWRAQVDQHARLRPWRCLVPDLGHDVASSLPPCLAMAAAGDVRIMRFGMARGRPRLSRHLWRMCFALFIAAGSFFSIRERVASILPEPFTDWADARAADRAAIRRDVLLVVAGPRPPRVATARPTRFGRARNLTADYAARLSQRRSNAPRLTVPLSVTRPTIAVVAAS